MPSAAPIQQAIIRGVLKMRATVWRRTNNTGTFNNAVKTGLACYMAPVNIQPAATSANRADLAAVRTFMWDPTYDLVTQGTQIEITSPARFAGQRWNIQVGTDRPVAPPGFDDQVFIECDVRRAS